MKRLWVISKWATIGLLAHFGLSLIIWMGWFVFSVWDSFRGDAVYWSCYLHGLPPTGIFAGSAIALVYVRRQKPAGLFLCAFLWVAAVLLFLYDVHGEHYQIQWMNDTGCHHQYFTWWWYGQVL
jgi:hypothetical protein